VRKKEFGTSPSSEVQAMYLHDAVFITVIEEAPSLRSEGMVFPR